MAELLSLQKCGKHVTYDGVVNNSGLKLFPGLYSIERYSNSNFVTMVSKLYNSWAWTIVALILKEDEKVELGNLIKKENLFISKIFTYLLSHYQIVD